MKIIEHFIARIGFANFHSFVDRVGFTFVVVDFIVFLAFDFDQP